MERRAALWPIISEAFFVFQVPMPLPGESFWSQTKVPNRSGDSPRYPFYNAPTDVAVPAKMAKGERPSTAGNHPTPVDPTAHASLPCRITSIAFSGTASV